MIQLRFTIENPNHVIFKIRLPEMEINYEMYGPIRKLNRSNIVTFHQAIKTNIEQYPGYVLMCISM